MRNDDEPRKTRITRKTCNVFVFVFFAVIPIGEPKIRDHGSHGKKWFEVITLIHDLREIGGSFCPANCAMPLSWGLITEHLR